MLALEENRREKLHTSILRTSKVLVQRQLTPFYANILEWGRSVIPRPFSETEKLVCEDSCNGMNKGFENGTSIHIFEIISV